MKKNDVYRVKIDGLTNLGFGTARVDGMVVFVPDTVTGDEADIKIIKIFSSYAVGKTEKLIHASPDRCNGRCGSDTCRSCAYKNISYEKELELKANDCISSFRKEGLSHILLKEVVPSPKLTEYRNKAQYPISKGKNGEYLIGFYAPKSHRVCEARYCPLTPKIFGDICSTLEEFFKKYALSVYDENTGEGLLRHIYLRQGEVSGEILLTLVINGDKIPHGDILCDTLSARYPDIKGVLLNKNTKNTNVILSSDFTLLCGRDYIYDTLCGVKLKISAPSFYQVNHSACEILYKKARELAALKKSDTLLDLYCGIGSIGLSMAEDCKQLIGIEIVPSAVICARENAKEAQIPNAKFYTGDAKNTSMLLKNAEDELGRKIEPDVVILDPPRGGCDRELIEFVSKLAPARIVYISCNHSTLARDIKIFNSFGYGNDSAIGVDLFPMTGHVETLTCLVKNG